MNSPKVDIQRLKHFIPFDSLNDSSVNDIVEHITVNTLPKGKILFKRGQHDNICHFLISGSIDLADEHFAITKIEGADEDNYLALDNSAAIHRHTAISTSECIFYAIDRDHLDLVTTWAQLVAEGLNGEDEELEHQDWMDVLFTSNLFTKIPPTNIQKLLARFQTREAKIGEPIIRENDEGLHFYVIKDGRALVTRKDDYGKEETLAALQEGNFFGEDALIGGTTRNANVTMASNGVLMMLGAEDFAELLQKPVVHFVDHNQVEDMMENSDRGTVLLDVRTVEEYRAGHLVHSKNIPLKHLRQKLDDLNPEFQYIVCCDGGRRSDVGSYILTEAGYNSYSLK